MFKKEQWRFLLEDSHGKTLLCDMTAQTEHNGVMVSTGILLQDGQYKGTAVFKTNNFFQATRKPKKAAKGMAYALAHKLAVNAFTNGKIGLANKIVTDHFDVDDDRAVRAARKNYLKNIGESLFLYVVTDRFEKSGVILISEPDKLKINGQIFEYQGMGAAWCGGQSKAMIGGLSVDGEIDDDTGRVRLKIDLIEK